MKTNWKFKVPIGCEYRIPLLAIRPSEIRLVHAEGPEKMIGTLANDSITVWIEHPIGVIARSGDRPVFSFRVAVYGTGEGIPAGWDHADTVLVDPYVWHVYTQVVSI